jgi:hypothetical protein
MALNWTLRPSRISPSRIKPFLGPPVNACPRLDSEALGITEEDRALPRKRDIEAAIAAYNDAAQALLLPPEAARLLAAMFSRHSVCQRSLQDLAGEGFDERALRRLLRGLIEAGFLSKEPPSGRIPTTYRLHLPPRAQP